jgi:hypothetical protein
VGASEVPPQIHFKGASAFGGNSLTRFRDCDGPSGIYAAHNTTTNARTAGDYCAIAAAKAKARAMMVAASNGRCKTSVRLQRSLAIVAAFMFSPIAGAKPYRFRNTRLQSMMMFDRRHRLSGSRKARV